MTSPPRRNNQKSPTKSIEFYDQEKNPVNSSKRQTLHGSLTELTVPDETDLVQTPSQTSTLCPKSYNPVRSYTYDGCFGDTHATGVKSLSEKEFSLSPLSFGRESLRKAVITTNKVIHIDIAPANEYNVEDAESNKEKLLYIHEIQVFKDKVSVENTSSIEIIESKKEFRGARTQKNCSFLRSAQESDNKKNMHHSPGLSIECSQKNCYPSGSFDTIDKHVSKSSLPSKIPRPHRKSKSSSMVPKHSKRVMVTTDTSETFVQTDDPTVNKRKSTLKTGFLRLFISFARCFM